MESLWGLQGIGPTGDQAYRIFIPIKYRGEIVSWTTRSIRDKGLRYLSASSEQERLPHKNLLYGEDLCFNVVIVVEGPFDVYRTGPGAVATFGTSYSREQLLKISKYPVRVICFDAEVQAQVQARKMVAELSCFPGKTYNVVLDSKDAGAASDKEIKALRKFLK
jgi:hypothetical protein